MHSLSVWRGLFTLATLALIGTPSSARAEEKYWYGLTAKHFGRIFHELEPKGWRPSGLRGYASGKHSRYRITWKSGGGLNWRMYIGMTPADYRRRHRELAKEDYWVAELSIWRVDGKKRYAAIWRKE